MSDRECHVILGEWLRHMGYPKDTYPTEEELKTLCLGKLRFFWKDVIRNIKPNNEVRFIRENIFVKTIRSFEKIENTSRVMLGQVLPPPSLLYWKKRKELNEKICELRNATQLQERLLTEANINTKNKYAEEYRNKTEVLNSERQIRLAEETIYQLNKDIAHSREVNKVISSMPRVSKIISGHSSRIGGDCERAKNYDSPKYTNMSLKDELLTEVINNLHKPSSKVSDVETLMENLEVSEFWEAISSRRETKGEIVLCAANEADLPSELARVRGGRAWKEGLAELSALQMRVALTGLEQRQQAATARTYLSVRLKNHVKPAIPSCQHIDILELQCKRTELNAVLRSLREDLALISSGNGILATCSDPSNIIVSAHDNFQHTMMVLRENILSLHADFQQKESEIKCNIVRLSEGVDIAKNIQKNVLIALGCSGDDAFTFLSNNVTTNTSTNVSSITGFCDLSNISTNFKNLNILNVKKIYSTSAIRNNISEASRVLLKEIKFLNQFGLELNRKIVLNNGDDLRIDETLHNASALSLKDDEILFKVMNPTRNVSSVIHILYSLFEWRDKLKALHSKQIEDLASQEVYNFNMPEDTSRRTDMILINVKNGLKPLQNMEERISNYYEHLDFFSNCNLKIFISNNRREDEKTYHEHEAEINNIMLENAYNQ